MNPVVVEVTRGERVEAQHRGAGIIVDADGTQRFAFGDVERPVFPRSAVKPLQTLLLVESGAAEQLGFGPEALALASGSHSGEPAHVELAGRMLAAAGFSEADLACHAHWPLGEDAARAVAAGRAAPCRLHNNCSGKHAGFLAAARTLDIDAAGYHRAEHRIQRESRATIEALSGFAIDPQSAATDGCSIPTYPLPLPSLALAMARFATGAGLDPQRARAARHIRESIAAAPLMLAGSHRLDTDITAMLGDKILIKTGAEGVYAAALPEAGIGIALKIDDGAARASEAVIGGMVSMLLGGELGARVRERYSRDVTTWGGEPVGRIAMTGPLEDALKTALGQKAPE